MKEVCASGDVVPGYDVSHYQPNLSIHSQMAAQGNKFCFIKATDGAGVTDRLFSEHWKAAKAAGMIVGPYAFFHPSQDPNAQAALMEKVIGKLGPGDLAPVIDWESTDGIASANDAARGLQFLENVAAVTGKDPIVYGGPYFLQALGLSAALQKYPLWVAHYGVKCPMTPSPWGVWSFWQFSGTGPLDLDVFNGSLEQLQKMAGL